jgi:NAD(P)H-dependent flavin oxidoreductase YrpB (nitropropane dioxygenase family)
MVPAVVDLAGAIPVTASGGIVDGRGLAAAVVRGRVGHSRRATHRLHRPVEPDPSGAHAAADQLRDQIRAAAVEGRLDELHPFTGQSARLVHDLAPAAELITRIASEAEAGLRDSNRLIRHPTGPVLKGVRSLKLDEPLRDGIGVRQTCLVALAHQRTDGCRKG